MATVYFADTFYWIALIHPKDAWHGRVVAWTASHASSHLTTTTEVLTEALNWFAARGPAGRVLAFTSVRIICAGGCVDPGTPADHGRLRRGADAL